MEKAKGHLQPLTDCYARQRIFKRLRKMGIEKEDITAGMITLEKIRLEGVRLLRQIKKIGKERPQAWRSTHPPIN